MEWLLFALGFPAALLTAYGYDILKGMIKARSDRLAIEGFWLEFVRDSKNHQYSHGRIRFDKKRGFWAFDGTNYKNNGEPFCHWETVSSHVDVAGRKFFYTFVARVENELDKTYYGFGVVNLVVNDRDQLVPVDGHYVSANVDGRGMSHSMVPTDLRYGRTMQGARVLEAVKISKARPRKPIGRPGSADTIA